MNYYLEGVLVRNRADIQRQQPSPLVLLYENGKPFLYSYNNITGNYKLCAEYNCIDYKFNALNIGRTLSIIDCWAYFDSSGGSGPPGPQGPQGPQGLPGQDGPQGPPGPEITYKPHRVMFSRSPGGEPAVNDKFGYNENDNRLILSPSDPDTVLSGMQNVLLMNPGGDYRSNLVYGRNVNNTTKPSDDLRSIVVGQNSAVRPVGQNTAITNNSDLSGANSVYLSQGATVVATDSISVQRSSSSTLNNSVGITSGNTGSLTATNSAVVGRIATSAAFTNSAVMGTGISVANNPVVNSTIIGNENSLDRFSRSVLVGHKNSAISSTVSAAEAINLGIENTISGNGSSRCMNVGYSNAIASGQAASVYGISNTGNSIVNMAIIGSSNKCSTFPIPGSEATTTRCVVGGSSNIVNGLDGGAVIGRDNRVCDTSTSARDFFKCRDMTIIGSNNNTGDMELTNIYGADNTVTANRKLSNYIAIGRENTFVSTNSSTPSDLPDNLSVKVIGNENEITDLASSILAGDSNIITDSHNSNMIGTGNEIDDFKNSTISGNNNVIEQSINLHIIGSSNEINGTSSSTVNGNENTVISSSNAYVVGGENNITRGLYLFCGGVNNTITSAGNSNFICRDSVIDGASDFNVLGRNHTTTGGLNLNMMGTSNTVTESENIVLFGSNNVIENSSNSFSIGNNNIMDGFTGSGILGSNIDLTTVTPKRTIFISPNAMIPHNLDTTPGIHTSGSVAVQSVDNVGYYDDIQVRYIKDTAGVAPVIDYFTEMNGITPVMHNGFLTIPDTTSMGAPNNSSQVNLRSQVSCLLGVVKDLVTQLDAANAEIATILARLTAAGIP